MGLFGGTTGGQQVQDFVNRYEQGAPSEGYTDQEVAQRFQQVAPQLTPEQFQQAAMQSFQRMTPEERSQFGQMLQQQAQQAGAGFTQAGDTSFRDSATLAQAVAQVHQQQPGLLGQLLGGGGQGGRTWETLDPQTKDLFIRTWGNRAQAEWEKENAQAHSPFHSPVAKAAMAGIAAIALKNLVSNR